MPLPTVQVFHGVLAPLYHLHCLALRIQIRFGLWSGGEGECNAAEESAYPKFGQCPWVCPSADSWRLDPKPGGRRHGHKQIASDVAGSEESSLVVVTAEAAQSLVQRLRETSDRRPSCGELGIAEPEPKRISVLQDEKQG